MVVVTWRPRVLFHLSPSRAYTTNPYKILQNFLIDSSGSFSYTGAEVMLGSRHRKPADVWLPDITAYTLRYSHSLFRSEEFQELIEDVQDREIIFR